MQKPMFVIGGIICASSETEILQTMSIAEKETDLLERSADVPLHRKDWWES